VIIDTHCHLNFNLFDDDLAEVVSRARLAGVGRIVVPATDIQTSLEAIELSQQIPEVYAAVGIHPNDSTDFSLRDIDRLHDLAKNPKVVAVGEIGLDRFHDDVDLPRQIIAFEAQLELAKELKLPVLVHNREADQEIGPLLEKWFHPDEHKSSGIMHAFSSSLDFARSVIELGFSLGVGGPITYKNAEDKRQVFRIIEKDKIVIETDAPFLSPQQKRGKRNEPAYTIYVAEELSRIWEIPLADVMDTTTRNAARIFKWNNLN